MAIPMIMVVFPVGGAFLGHWAGKYFERPWLVFVGLGLGLFLGTREVIRLVKELKVVQSDNDKGK